MFSLLLEMAQDKCWMARYNEVKEFIEREHRNPSKYRDEETDGSLFETWKKAVGCGRVAGNKAGEV